MFAGPFPIVRIGSVQFGEGLWRSNGHELVTKTTAIRGETETPRTAPPSRPVMLNRVRLLSRRGRGAVTVALNSFYNKLWHSSAVLHLSLSL
jgi:hypothetical protein